MGDMTNTKLPPPLWVANKTALEEMIDALAKEPRIAIDTESNSLYAYQEQVCLIQFSTPAQDFLLDPFALPELQALQPIFENEQIEKIFHAAEYDLICLKRDFGFTFNHLFDTMIAARILGYEKVGLGSLLQQKFNVTVDKKFQKANWGKRPLSDEMLSYARLDTHYLIELRNIIERELEEEKRRALAEEDFSLTASLAGINNHTPLPIWERVGGRDKLDPRQATVLNEVCLTREALAAKLNRPPFKIISNKALLALAHTQPRNRRELEAKCFSQRQAQRFGKPFLNAVKDGLSAPLVKRTPRKRPGDSYHIRYENLRNWRKERAKLLGVESDVILPRFLMEKIAKENPRDMKTLSKIMVDSPWRLEEYGEEILRVLAR